jgi:uncharacterized membrane protein
MTANDPTATRYLSQFRVCLERYRVPSPDEIVIDLGNHISEATGAGKPVAVVIAALGSPDKLARAYAIELLLNPPKESRTTAVMRVLRITGLLVAGGFFSLFIVFTLGLIGLALLATGPALIVGGVLQSLGDHPWWINTGNLSPLAVISLGPLALAVGAGICWILWRYIRMTARTMRKILPAPL